MKHATDGGPAFPTPRYVAVRDGMSLRDWFAGQALNGMLSYSRNDAGGSWYSTSETDAARAAYEYADAMLAARKESQ